LARKSTTILVYSKVLLIFLFNRKVRKAGCPLSASRPAPKGGLILEHDLIPLKQKKSTPL
jgi:hypothetical protein